MEAVLAGALCKVYDDLFDNQLTTGWIMEALKGLQWVFLSFLMSNDFNFAIVIYFGNIFNSIADPDAWTDPYEKSLLIVCPVFLLMSFRNAHIPTWMDLLVMICLIMYLPLDPILVQDEVSVLKWFFRSGCFVYAVLVSYVGSRIGISPSFVKMANYCAGYALVSSLFQVAMLTSSGTFSLPSSDLL